jgi:hypothetical protein
MDDDWFAYHYSGDWQINPEIIEGAFTGITRKFMGIPADTDKGFHSATSKGRSHHDILI